MTTTCLMDGKCFVCAGDCKFAPFRRRIDELEAIIRRASWLLASREATESDIILWAHSVLAEAKVPGAAVP